jgi:hypothetical protein
MAKGKKSLFSTTESKLKKHVEANKSKVVDITSNEDVVADELAQLKAIEESQAKQTTADSSFSLPNPEELEKLAQSLKEEEEEGEKNTLETESENKDFEGNRNSLEDVLEKQNEKAKEVEKNIKLKTSAATVKHHHVKKSIKDASVEAGERQEKAEKFKEEINKLMAKFGYSFMDAKRVYETQQEVDKEQTFPKATSHIINVSQVNQKKK